MRPLTADDATDRYLGWLRDDSTRRFIVSAEAMSDRSDLRTYIQQRSALEDVLFLGIFDAKNGDHLGNIKFEPLDISAGYAVLGILVGDLNWRGKGLATEVLEASTDWLSIHLGIGEFVLDVKRDNLAAIRAYGKAGFREEQTCRIAIDPAKSMTMVRRTHMAEIHHSPLQTTADRNRG